MSKEIVQYRSDMNTVAFRKFDNLEMNILMALITNLKEEGTKKVCFTFTELKELTNIQGNYTIEQFAKKLDNVYNKIISTTIRIGDSQRWTRFVLFSYYTIDLREKTVTVGVNEDFKFVLNNLTEKFTKYNLDEYVNYKSSYTKELFRRIKQFEKTGEWFVNIEEFKYQLNIPKSYRMSEIDRVVLSAIKKDLKKDYKLKIKKIYETKQGKTAGRPKVVALHFTFKLRDDIDTEEQEKSKKIKYVMMKDFEDYVKCEILSVKEENNEIVLIVKNIKTNRILSKKFEHIQHYTNFIMKFGRK